MTADFVTYAIHALAGVALLIFLGFRARTYLLFFQQEEYDAPRFLRWVVRMGAADVVFSALMLISAFAVWGFRGDPRILWLIISVLAALAAWRAVRLNARAKKPLVMTSRATRIWRLDMILTTITGLALYLPARQAGALSVALWVLLLVHLAPLMLILANLLLSPAERAVKGRYRKEAEEIFEKLAPKTIGITGSYGKTSVKHLLAHILSGASPTLATPGSVNTEMGITRIIREELESRHKFFVVEMGAYGPGSIHRLCRLTPPDLAIISSVGKAHLERFGDVETTFHAKFELAAAAIAKGGKVVANVDGIPGDLLGDWLAADRAHFILCGTPGGGVDLDWRLEEARQTPEGLALRIRGPEEARWPEEALTVPIYGLHQASNILLSIAAASELGIGAEMIVGALKMMPQIRHRLEVIRGAHGPTIIDDAYNSNPVGFEAAVRLLNELATTGARRVVITPGMVELGADHDDEHYRLGELAGPLADVFLVVGPERIEAFVDGANITRRDGSQLILFETQAKAEAWYKAHGKPTDVVLFENNLPDLYEADFVL